MAKLLQILDRTNIKEMQNIIDNLEEGEKHVQYSIDKNVVLILGNAGSGKTILTQFIAGSDDLVSKKLKDSVGYYIAEKNQTTKFPLDNWRTFVPNLVQDAKTNTTFYDCPGFLNTVNEVNDISAGYYLKNVIDTSGSVKLVFTIAHDSLKNKKVFLSQLVKPAIKLVKNFERFKNSITLVVTKVMEPKEFRNNHDEVTDESTIRDIGKILQNLTYELESHIGNDRLIYPKEIYSDGLPFIKGLLVSNRGKFSKIGIFKMPTSSGELSNMTLLQENRESLRKIIYENIEFSPHNDEDFGYSISGESILYIKSLANEINDKVASEIRVIGQQIERHYHNQEEQTHDIKALCDELHSSYTTLSNTQSGIFEFSEPQQLVSQIAKNVNDLNIDHISNSTFDRIEDYAEYITFLRNLMNNESTLIDPPKWAHALTNILRILDKSHWWYNFLKNLPIILSKYDVQRDLTQYAEVIRILQSHIADSESNKQSIIESLKVLLYKISKDDFERELIGIKDVSLDNHKLKHLNHILNLTLKNNTISSREGDKLIIKSRYVKLSDIASEDFTNVKSMEIFALNKVFIDTSLNMTTDLSQIFIISPEWEIIGYPEIRLNNKSKSAHNVESIVGVGQNFHGHGHLSIITEENEARNIQWFGKNIKIIVGEESLVKYDNDFVDAQNVKIVKLSDHFEFPVNDAQKGENSTRIQDLQPVTDIRIHSTINDFKSYARKSLISDIQESFLRSFVQLLENHKYVKNSYIPLGFVNELYDIEDQFFTLGKHISFLPFYQSFLHRLNEYAKNNSDKLTNDDKKVLSYLNAIIMSKIYCNNDDIPDYFAKHLDLTWETVNDDIEKLTKSNSLNDAIFINYCQLNEQKLIEETSNEVHNFIEMQIKPNMDVFFLKVDELSSKELIKLKILSCISEKLTEFLDFVSLIGPRAASVIKRSTAEESSQLDDANKIYNMYPITDLLNAVQNFDSILKNQLENKKLLLTEILIEIGQELTLFLTKHPSNELSKIESKIFETKQSLNEKTNDFLSMDELYNIQKEIAGLIQKRKKA